MDACQTCRSEFACSQLATAIKIVSAMPELATKPRLRMAYDQLKAKLDAVAWRYPDADSPCALAGHDAEINRLTKQLIDAMRAVRADRGYPAEAPIASILSEEHWHE